MRRTSFASESESSQHPASEGALAERPLFVGFELTKVRGRALADPRSRPAAPAPARSPRPRPWGTQSRSGCPESSRSWRPIFRATAEVLRPHPARIARWPPRFRYACGQRCHTRSHRGGQRPNPSFHRPDQQSPDRVFVEGLAWDQIKGRHGGLASQPAGLSERGSPTRKETKTLGFPLTLEGCKSQRPCLAWPHLKIRTKMMMIRIRTTTPPPMYIDSPFLFGE